MSDQPQTDHELCIRLAKLCGFPIQADWQDFYPESYPQLRRDIDDTLLFVETDRGGDDPWNPLEDERQAFRHVVKALKSLGFWWEMKQSENEDVKVSVGRQVRYGVSGIYSTQHYEPGGTACRALCLAALEAWEKLEKEPTCTKSEPRETVAEGNMARRITIAHLEAGHKPGTPEWPCRGEAGGA